MNHTRQWVEGLSVPVEHADIYVICGAQLGAVY